MKIQKLKLYHYPASRSARVKWALHECVGDDFEVTRVDLYGGAQYSREFMQLNPNHCVPLLDITWDTGKSQRMIESAAMVGSPGQASRRRVHGLGESASDAGGARCRCRRRRRAASRQNRPAVFSRRMR